MHLVTTTTDEFKFVPVLHFEQSSTVQPPTYIGGLYPLDDVIDLTAYISRVTVQGGAYNRLNATCSYGGFGEDDISTYVVNVILTHKHTNEQFEHDLMAAMIQNRLHVVIPFEDNGEYTVKVYYGNTMLYRDAVSVDTPSLVTYGQAMLMEPFEEHSAPNTIVERDININYIER